jgi:hypothetical protein
MSTCARPAVFLVLGLAVACGPAPATLVPDSKPLGFVMLTQQRYALDDDVVTEVTGSEVHGFARFAQVAREDAEELLADPLADVSAALGGCTVELPYYPNDPFIPSWPFALALDPGLDAGAALTLLAGGESFATFSRVHGEDGLAYYLDLEPGTQLPRDMSLVVPGADFPSMQAALPDAVDLELTSPEPEDGLFMIGADTVFTWSPGTNGAVVGLLAVDLQEEAFLACVADDEAGEFVLPAEIAGEGFEGVLIAAGRLVAAVVEEGDAALLLVVASTLDLVGSPLPPEPDLLDVPSP